MTSTRNWIAALASTALLSLAAIAAPAAPALSTRPAGPEPVATAAGVRQQIESVLAEMQAAVLAGDIDAYMSHVATDDATFLKERKNWAADLAKFKPAQFVLSIRPDPTIEAPVPDKPAAEKPAAEAPAADRPAPKPLDWKDRPASFEPARARFTLTINWLMPQNEKNVGPQGKGGRNRMIEYPVVFTKGADGKWLYTGEDWAVMELLPGQEGAPEGFAGVRVKYDPALEGMAKAVIAAMPDVRSHVDGGFENRITRVQEVKLYGSMGHLQESIYLSYSDSLGGWNEPDEAIKMLGGRGGRGSVSKTVLAHEYGHVATFALGDKANDAPWWVLEGVAELSAAKFRSNPVDRLNGMIVRWARANNLAKWDDLADFRNTEGKWWGHVYSQGEHMLMFVSDRFGRAGRNAWLRAMGKGKSIDEASKEALGMSFADLDRKWRDHVADLVKADDERRAKEDADKKPDAPAPAPGGKPGEPAAPGKPPKAVPEQPRQVPGA